MDKLMNLADAAHVARFQRFCGIELIKPGTCDQQTQTKRQPSVEEKGVPNGSVGTSPDTDAVGRDTIINNGGNVHRRKISPNAGPGSNNAQVTECNNNGVIKGTQLDEFCNGAELKACNGHACTEADLAKPYMSKNGKVANGCGTGIKEAPSKTSPAYRIKYKSLLYLAHFGAFLGNEEFYLTFFPFCVWNLDSLIVRQVALLWGLVMYLGQATKDYLCWPRPACPPVVRLEFLYLQEFSMPSTHAMAATAIPLYMAHLIVDRYQFSISVAAGLALFWFVTTCYSRLYLGVHTILDLIAGVIFALSLYVTFIKYIEDYDLYQQTHQFAPVMVVVTAIMMCTICYPSQHKITSKGDAVQIVSAVAGFSVGFWLHYQLGYTHMPSVPTVYTISVPTLSWIFLSILRFGSGLVVLGVFYLAAKPATIRFFSYLYGLEFPDATNTNVVTGYKFTVYFTLGILISFFIPLLHVWLGIPRLSFFEEVV